MSGAVESGSADDRDDARARRPTHADADEPLAGRCSTRRPCRCRRASIWTATLPGRVAGDGQDHDRDRRDHEHRRAGRGGGRSTAAAAQRPSGARPRASGSRNVDCRVAGARTARRARPTAKSVPRTASMTHGSMSRNRRRELASNRTDGLRRSTWSTYRQARDAGIGPGTTRAYIPRCTRARRPADAAAAGGGRRNDRRGRRSDGRDRRIVARHDDGSPQEHP